MPPSTSLTSYILVEVQSSNGGEEEWGHNQITLTDGHRQVLLDFFLGTPQHRRFSMTTIDRLINLLTGFRSALQLESELISKKRTRPFAKRTK